MSTASDLLTISQIVARLPGSRGARRLHPATVTRRILTGCPDRNGNRVKLTATRAGSRWLVRAADLDAFFATLAAEPVGSASPPAIRDPDSRQRAAEKAAEKLEAMGA